MRLNGLWIVAHLAVKAVGDPILARYEKALVLGALREDVWHLPGDRIFEHQSWSHFYHPWLPGGFFPLLWPGPRSKGKRFYRRALDELRAGRTAAAFAELGRAVHLVTDMSCPVHVHRTIHETDPYEWWVEANKDELLALPVPPVADFERPEDVIEAMARITSAWRPDGTNWWAGRLLARAGLRKRVGKAEAAEQARALIPVCAGHAAALLRLFLREAGTRTLAPA